MRISSVRIISLIKIGETKRPFIFRMKNLKDGRFFLSNKTNCKYQL